ncbi:AMP-binding protein [Megalodesulfovibrio gigas]|uniref:Putative Long-chain-fatty-acid--CoA ligase n=1 Tax=Megalodesulfovibrio gigas (strain ATCC 19364 / DSM 1382 / NCIMB 9332 / VKM B-1759) TaxID=1121448 RepID=T2GDM3_MEGG1|nr:AMP-binding protein [Megalodesulfovibrio gigas]AGW14216.1 putative Long-chain-fatty-acid--CoA ligase [Megalodesulfovibrio gigas DSM 1382 = ATCC 19364]
MFSTLQDVIAVMPGRGDKPAVVLFAETGPQTLTYRELHAQAQAVAQGLLARGVARGEAVGLMIHACPEAFVAALGILEAGGVVLPVDAQLAGEGLAHVVGDSSLRFVFTAAEHVPVLQDAGVNPEHCLLLDAPATAPHSWRELLHHAGDARFLPRMTADESAALFYTSGTTGRPKGVPLTHGNIIFQQNALVEAKLIHATDTMLLPLPLHHVYPFVIGIFTSLSLGLTVVLPQSLTGPHVLGAVKEGGVTLIAGVPRLYTAMLTGIRGKAAAKGVVARIAFEKMVATSAWIKDKTGLRVGKVLLRSLHEAVGPKLRVLASGGSPLDADVARDLEALGWQVAVGYGLTETSPILALDAPGDARPGTVGRPLPGVSIRLAHVPGLETLPEGVGEVQARGAGVFGGYRNLPEKTAEAFTEDGWFRTGDLGRLDPDGRLTLFGRASVMIVTQGGENVDPEKVEQALETHPVIAEAAVLAWKGGLAALIVPDPVETRSRRSNIDEVVREAVTQVAQRLPSYQRPVDVAVTPVPLLRTRLGKLRRHVLAEQFERAKAGMIVADADTGPLPEERWKEADRTLLDHEAARAVWNWLRERYADARLSPDTQMQLDLGVDSLEWLVIGLALKDAAGVEISEEAAARIVTVRDLLQEAVAASAATGENAPAPRAGADVKTIIEHPEAALTPEQQHWITPLAPWMRGVAWFVWLCFRMLAKMLFSMEVRGVERLRDVRQFVLAPNHLSYLDPFVVLPAVPFDVLRRMQVAGWTGAAFHNPVNRFFSRLAQTVPIDPDKGVAASLALGAAVLKLGRSLLWFPEGVRSTSGELREFRPGLGLLLERYPATVVPVCIHGTWEAMPPGRFSLRRVKVVVQFGEPVSPRVLLEDMRDTAGQMPAAQRMMQAVRQRVAVMQQALRAEFGGRA